MSEPGRSIQLFELENRNGTRARLIDWGATLTSLEVRDREGQLGDVVLGFDDPDRYRRAHPHFGCTVGRYANRIAGGRFSLGGRSYSLANNNGDNHLHGGAVGFDSVFWEAEPVRETREQLKARGLETVVLSPTPNAPAQGNLLTHLTQGARDLREAGAPHP